MSFWCPKNIALISVTRVFLLASVIHFGQIIYGAFAGISDGPTHVGFPFVFASWAGGPCFGVCSSFHVAPLLGTLAFWATLSFCTALYFRSR